MLLQGAATNDYTTSADDFRQAEFTVLRQAQRDSFHNELAQLDTGKSLCSDTWLLTLAPEVGIFYYKSNTSKQLSSNCKHSCT